MNQVKSAERARPSCEGDSRCSRIDTNTTESTKIDSVGTPQKTTPGDASSRFRIIPGSSATCLRLSGPIEHDSIVNGPGLRAVVWTQGCFTHCVGCQNAETWSPNAGTLVDVAEIKAELKKLKGQSGLTFCGGEPFVQAEACKAIADWAREEMGWNVWSFSGFTYEEIKAHGGAAWELLKSLDALIDGPFILAQRDISLKFRGSRNQRLLHLDHGRITSIE